MADDISSVPLTPEEILFLRQARNGARSLGWLVLFFGMTAIMLYGMASTLTGVGAIIGTLLVVLFTAWILMLFVSRLGRWVADLLLKLFSRKHRLLFRLEKEGVIPRK